MIGSVGRALLLLALPLSEVAALRWYVHSKLGLHLGWSGATDYDFILPIPIAFIALIIALERDRRCEPHLRKGILSLNAVAILAFLTVNYSFDWLSLVSPVLFPSLWFGLATLIVMTAFTAFTGFEFYLNNRYRYAFLPCALVGSSIYLLNNYFGFLWESTAFLTSQAVCHSSRWLLSDIACYFNPPKQMVVSHPNLTIAITAGCGGLEGLFVFSFLFVLFSTLTLPLLSARSWIVAYVFGLFFVFFLNIVRIGSIFAVAVTFDRFGLRKEGVKLLTAFFHTNAGWVIYAVGIGAYFWTLSKIQSAGQKIKYRLAPAT